MAALFLADILEEVRVGYLWQDISVYHSFSLETGHRPAGGGDFAYFLLGD